MRWVKDRLLVLPTGSERSPARRRWRTKTHVEGMNLSAYTSLVRQANEIARSAIVGVPVAYDESMKGDFEPGRIINQQSTEPTNAVRPVNSNVVLSPDRLPGESPRAYRAFRVYRDQGPQRSLRAAWIANRQNRDKAPKSCRPRLAHGATRQSAGHWTAWSSQWSWVARAAAYDTLVDKSEQKAQCYRAIELEQQHLNFEIANQHRLRNRLEKMEALTVKAVDAPVVGSTHSMKRRWFDGSSVQRRRRIGG